MEGLIPFVIDVIRRSQERCGGAYRSVSSDGGSSRGGGGSSRRHLIDYAELPDQAAADDGQFSGAHHRCARSDFVQTTPAAVAAGSAYRRK